jgi:hypothetical protein
MKMFSLKPVVLFAGFAIAVGIPTSRAVSITSAGDPALVGASLETFNSLTPSGFSTTFTSVSLTDLSVTAAGGFYIDSGGNGVYVPPNPSGDVYLLSNANSTMTFTFNSAVSAFGAVFGATNAVQTITAFDSSGSVLGTTLIPNQVSSQAYPYSGYYGWASTSANIKSFSVTSSSGDYWVVDDLSYQTGDTGNSSVPDSGASVALLGLGLGSLIALRRKFNRG